MRQFPTHAFCCFAMIITGVVLILISLPGWIYLAIVGCVLVCVGFMWLRPR